MHLKYMPENTQVAVPIQELIKETIQDISCQMEVTHMSTSSQGISMKIKQQDITDIVTVAEFIHTISNRVKIWNRQVTRQAMIFQMFRNGYSTEKSKIVLHKLLTI